ncbi:MAG: transcriptional regulator [Alphaproteobacteria bacterium]|nr:transcriptional regulator [Alphaproteobacteria bacterium]
MALETLRLITIVAEADIAARLTAELARLGVMGSNVTAGEGAWRRALEGHGPHEWSGPTVRIEAVVSPRVADAVLARLSLAWFPHYAVFAWVCDVGVARPGKYA